MALEVVLTLSLFIAAGLFAYWRGGPPEKYAAIVIMVWVIASVGYSQVFGAPDFGSVDPGYAILDGAELIAIMVLALHANRLWPLWAAAAQLICVSGHIAAFIQPDGMRRAYWVMTQIPPFIQIVALALGALAHAGREKRIGPYRSWRGAHPA